MILTTFFTLLFRTFRPLKVGMTPLGLKFELQIQVFDPSNTAEQKTIGLGCPLGSINGVQNEKNPIYRFFTFDEA